MELPERLLKQTYTTADAAAALRHPNFGDFRKNLERLGLMVLPRHAQPGPGGGQYRYTHIAEMALQLELARFGRKTASGAIRTAFHAMDWTHQVNELPPDIRQLVFHGCSFKREEDPFEFGRYVDFPNETLPQHFKHRDPANPVFWMFDANRMIQAAETGVPGGDYFAVVWGEDPAHQPTLAAAHEALIINAQRAFGDPDDRELVREDLSAVGIVNVTTVLRFLDERLAFRLRVRELRGGAE